MLPIFFLLAGCYPIHQARTVDDRPGLAIMGAPENAILYIDGVEMGRAAQFDGYFKTLLLEPGTHHVEIHEGNTVIHSSDIFLGEGTRREIKLPGRKQ